MAPCTPSGSLPAEDIIRRCSASAPHVGMAAPRGQRPGLVHNDAALARLPLLDPRPVPPAPPPHALGHRRSPFTGPTASRGPLPASPSHGLTEAKLVTGHQRFLSARQVSGPARSLVCLCPSVYLTLSAALGAGSDYCSHLRAEQAEAQRHQGSFWSQQGAEVPVALPSVSGRGPVGI